MYKRAFKSEVGKRKKRSIHRTISTIMCVSEFVNENPEFLLEPSAQYKETPTKKNVSAEDSPKTLCASCKNTRSRSSLRVRKADPARILPSAIFVSLRFFKVRFSFRVSGNACNQSESELLETFNCSRISL